MKFATLAVFVATVSAQNDDGMPGQAEVGSQSVSIDAGRMGGVMSVNASNDFYSGNVAG